MGTRASVTCPVTVAVVEDHPLYRRAITETLSAHDDLRVVLSCGLIGELERYLTHSTVHVIVLDLGLPDAHGTEGVQLLARKGTPILVLSAGTSRGGVAAAFAAGAHGYLSKIADAADIVSGVRAVARGEIAVGLEVPGHLAAVSPGAGQIPRAPVLTAREREVLALVALGHTDETIARRLVIAVSTVRSHLDSIGQKTGHRRRVHLTRMAIDEGLIQGSLAS